MRTRVSSVIAGCLALLAAAGSGDLWASNMGFKIEHTLHEPDGGIRSKSGAQCLSLPFITKDGLQEASDLFEDLAAAGTLSIQRYVADTGTMQTYPPDNFPLLPGQGYLVTVRDTHVYRILGSHNTLTMVLLRSAAHPDSREGIQLVSIPYHSTAVTAHDLIAEIGGADVVESVGRYLSRTDTVQEYPGSVDFPMVPGEAYFIKIRPGQDRAWAPETTDNTGPVTGGKLVVGSPEDPRPEPNTGTDLHLADCSSPNPCSCSGGQICLWWKGTPGPFDAVWAPTPHFYSARGMARDRTENTLAFDDNTHWPGLYFDVTSQKRLAPIKRVRPGSYPLYKIDKSAPTPPETNGAGALQDDSSALAAEHAILAIPHSASEVRNLCDVATSARRADIPAHRHLSREIKFPRRQVDPVRYVARMLPGLYDADPYVRAETAARVGLARQKYGGVLREHDDRIAEHLSHVIRSDPEVQVVEEALRALGSWTGAVGLPDILADALQCTGSETLLQTVLQVAADNPNEVFLPELIDLWRPPQSEAVQMSVFLALLAQENPTTVWIGIEALTMPRFPAVQYLSATTTVNEVPQLVAAYHKYRDHAGFPHISLLDLISALGGEHAVRFLEGEFETETDGDIRSRTATFTLRAQLDPGKPTWTDADRRNCTSRDEFLSRRLPYIRADMERLLDPTNQEYLRAANWRGDAGGKVLQAFREGARAMTLDEQAAAWRYLIVTIGQTAPERVPRIFETARVELARSLARRASHQAETADPAAMTDIAEAIEVAGTTETFTRNSSASDALSVIQRRVARLSEGPLLATRTISLMDVAGEYVYSTKFSGARLEIGPDGRFERSFWSDVVDRCARGRVENGTARLEGEFVVLESDPTLSKRLEYSALGPEVYLWVHWGDRKYLVAEPDMESFCNSFNSGRLGTSRISSHYHSSSDGPIPEGEPSVPPEWRDWVLPEPIEGTVTDVDENQSATVSANGAERLKPGMLLYGIESDASGVWKVVSVAGHDVQVAPQSSASRAAVGGRVSTKPKDVRH